MQKKENPQQQEIKFTWGAIILIIMILPTLMLFIQIVEAIVILMIPASIYGYLKRRKSC